MNRLVTLPNYYMKKIALLLCLLITSFPTFAVVATQAEKLSLSAQNPSAFPKYKIIDLGTLETDESSAVAINENGHVLGTFTDNGKTSLFLWTAEQGLSVIELPMSDSKLGNCKLNTLDQIHGSYFNKVFKCNRAFIWDRLNGFIDIGSLGGDETHGGFFNDNGQVLGQSKVLANGELHTYLLTDQMIDLTFQFNQHIKGNWTNIRPAALNNLGHVLLHAEQKITLQNETKKYTKSFLYKDGEFLMILPGISLDTSLVCTDLDDDGNLIVQVCHPNHIEFLFINPENNISVRLFDSGYVIRNKKPIRIDEFPGKLKKDGNGNLHYTRGIPIKRLFTESESFYPEGSWPSITDQNSKGWVIGTMESLYQSYHAFLAVPENQIGEDQR